MLYSAMFSANHDDCVEDSSSIIVQIRRLAVMIMYSDVLDKNPQPMDIQESGQHTRIK